MSLSFYFNAVILGLDLGVLKWEAFVVVGHGVFFLSN